MKSFLCNYPTLTGFLKTFQYSSIYFLVLHLATLSLSAQAARDVGEQRECATCHIMWLRDFKRSDVTPLIDYDPKPVSKTGKEDVASTERMCFSCHDGFVLDSRQTWKKSGHGHPVGVKPSRDVQIPTSKGKIVFPLNDDGKIYCGTCHTAHGVDWQQKESPIFMRAKNINSSLCLACHLNRGTGPSEGNHPVFEPLLQQPDNLIVAGAKLGRDRTVICETCHSAHNASNRKMLVTHNRDSHLCQQCHENKKAVLGSKHDIGLMIPDAKNYSQQTPEQSGPCGACHTAHKALGPALWARQSTEGSDPASAACVGCHNKDGLAKDKITGEHSHPVSVSINKAGVTVSPTGWNASAQANRKEPIVALPLYDSNGVHTHENGNVGCGTCHDPHNWSPGGESLTRKELNKVDGNADNSFLRITGKNGLTLCTNCHSEKLAILNSKHSGDFQKPGKSKKISKQDDKNSNVCANCHAPHNARNVLLWNHDLASGKGHVEKMCSHCHADGQSAEAKKIQGHTHPMTVELKQGMEPSLPLFNQKGRAPKQSGKIDCATCHDLHQWNPADVADVSGKDPETEGNGLNSFLRLSAAGGSTLCTECHKEKAIIANSDHDMREKSLDTGLCGACHAAHNAKTEIALWALPVPDASDTVSGYCKNCHAPGKSASQKVPGESSHPDKVTVWSADMRKKFARASKESMPVYNQHGKPDIKGAIVCTTCHEPHQWSPDKIMLTSKKEIEGDITNSFLRVSNSENFVCTDCHGLDAIFRYKYFHSKSAHKKHPLYLK
ncbi:MAG: cytochrome c3 family protein [Gammaproteobacteria bacterium]|nr:cytochrome c3 family protein [Gammaproteobacteria bacterium]